MALVPCATALAAEKVRTDVLAQSCLIENLAAESDWAVDVRDTSITYTCHACGGEVVARLEVISPYGPDLHKTPRDRYLAERKLRCTELAANHAGRCVGTHQTGVRPSLGGFQSETEFPTRREIEISFFYHDVLWPGPELLRTTIEISDDATLPEGTVELLMWHMARLTLYW